MGDLEESKIIESEKPMEFGDSEAGKLATLLQDQEQSIECSLQQTIKIKNQKCSKSEGQDRSYVRLGPCFKPEKVEEVLDFLKECFPAKFTNPPFLNEPEKLVCHWVKSSNKPTNGWTCSVDTRPWFNRLSSRHERWKKLRIYEFLRLSTYPRFPFYDALTAGLVCCWNPCLNVFITGQGFRTITIEDIAFITGLSPSGIDLPTQSLIDGALDMEKMYPWKNKSNMPFSTIADYYNSIRNNSLSSDISRKEEVLFINFAFSKMMMFPSCNVNKTFLKLAANIEACGLDTSKAEPLCLAPLFLGQVYRCLYRLRTLERLYTAGGPVWIISLWGLFYFPFLAKEKGHVRLHYEELEAVFDKPTAVPVNECCCYGEVAIHSVSPVVHLSFEEVLKGLLFPSELSQSDWHPFSGNGETGIRLYLHDAKGALVEDTSGEWMKRAAPIWLLDLSCMNIREEDVRHWLSVLQPRDLICIEPKVIGVEAYNPNLVSRQFGMTQGLGIPFYKTFNRPWGTRPNILDTIPKSRDNKNHFAETCLKSLNSNMVSPSWISPWFRWAAVDLGYELWWDDFLRRCERSWPGAVVTLSKHVQGGTENDPHTSTTAQGSSSPKRKRGGDRTTIVSVPSQSSSQLKNSAQKTPGTRGQKRKTEKAVVGTTSLKKASIATTLLKKASIATTLLKKGTIGETEESDDAIITLIQHVKRLPQINHTRSTNQLPSSPNSKSTGTRMTIVAGLSKALSQVHFVPKSPKIWGQQKTTGKTLGATNLSSKKGTNEETQGSDDDILLSVLRERAIHPHHTVCVNSLSNGKDQRGTNTKTSGTLQDVHVEALDDRLNNHKETFHTASDFPENHGTITSEEVVVEVVSPEPEDSLEPPHEMVRGMGSSYRNDPKCLDLVAADPSCCSSLEGDEIALLNGEPMEEESDARDPVTPNNMSLALTIDRSFMPDYSGVSYTPDMALAEVNSVMTLIEDTLRPCPITSKFDSEKEKAQKIVGILQSNVKDPTTCFNLADQIHRLHLVSPPQFRPILAHYQTSFMSLQDQLKNIQEQEDSMAYSTDTLHDLNTRAKDLRDRLKTSQARIDQLQAECNQYNNEIEELEAKLVNLKQLRESKMQELSIEECKFTEFSSTLSDTIPILQKVAQTMVSAHQTKAQWECTLKTIKDNVDSFVGLLKTM